MARRQRDNLTADNFREAFHSAIKARVPSLPNMATDKQLIEAFEGLLDDQKRDFWPSVKRLLNCETDWPIKHYSNTFLAAKYSTKLKDCQAAKDIIRDVVCQAFEREEFDQKQTKRECYEILRKFDIFPIQIDNYIYHLVAELNEGEGVREISRPVAPTTLPQFRRLDNVLLDLSNPVQPAAPVGAEPASSNDIVMSINILSDMISSQQNIMVAQPSFQQLNFGLFSNPFSNSSAEE